MTGLMVIGAGQAGAQLAVSLREYGYSKPITVIGDEVHAPYQRPPLSKDFLRGKLSESQLYFRGSEVYRREDITLRLGITVKSVNCSAHAVQLDDGSDLSYDSLVFATGARGRELSWEHGTPSNVYALRSLDDAISLQGVLTNAKHALVIGAGFIGLEFASVARANGLDVTVAEMADRVMGRAVSRPTSDHFAGLHKAENVHLVLGSGVSEFYYDADGNVSGAWLEGKYLPVDVVVVGIGVHANSELAEEAGLEVNNGIVVDRNLQTSEPGIYAIGDCASFPDPQSQELVRLESVPNAAEQARYLAQVLTGETDEGYCFVPWFWSLQAGARLQIAGLSRPEDDAVALASADPRRFSIGRVREGRLVAVESINQPGEHMAARKLLSRSAHLSLEEITSPDFSLKHAARNETATV